MSGIDIRADAVASGVWVQTSTVLLEERNWLAQMDAKRYAMDL